MTMHAALAADLTLPFEVLDRLMPMHVVLNPDGRVRHLGPTIRKMLRRERVGPEMPGHETLGHETLGHETLGHATRGHEIRDPDAMIGARLQDLMELRRPAEPGEFRALMRRAGSRLSLVLKSAPHLPMRGVVMPLPDGSGAILDVSLGLSFVRAVSDFSLTLPDFSPCDQTVELLYLHEANTSTAQLSRHLSARLQADHASARFQARTDALTGLSNRRAIDDELEELLSTRQHEFSLLQLDLDLFKGVNDTYGHAAGDAVLVEVGCVLGRELRRNDFPARVGGDEFLVILRPALAPGVAGRIATRLIRRIEKPIRFENVQCHVSASIGIVSTTQYPKRPSAEQMMADVDAALYQAKNEGRGRFALFAAGKPFEAAKLRMRAQ